MKIKQEIINVLSNCNIEDNNLYLPNTQLDRKLYLDLMKVLETLNIKWGRKLKYHVCENTETDLKESINNLIETGEYIDIKKEYQQYYTPIEIVEEMIELAELYTGCWLLEPSAGIGNIILNLPNLNLDITCIELDKENCELLENNKPNNINFNIINGNFLDYDILFSFDRILMNPPFTKNQDIIHTMKAFDHLTDNGILVGILSSGAFSNSRKINDEFREFLKINNAEIFDLDSGAFKESGTMVSSKIIKIKKGK